MDKRRLDKYLFVNKLAATRSQAENFVRMGLVQVNGRVATKPGTMVGPDDKIRLVTGEQYVSRAGFKLASVAQLLKVDFKNKVVLDVGSSTGGFTDYALQQGARKVIAVDVGTKQLHPSLLGHPKIELHEQTDIRDVSLESRVSSHEQKVKVVITTPDLIIVDVSFISLRDVLPSISRLMTSDSQLVAMVKPQFEAGNARLKHKGVIKNDAMRRKVLKAFEDWAKNLFIVLDKADSEVSGAKGNVERFYLLKPSKGKRAAGTTDSSRRPT